MDKKLHEDLNRIRKLSGLNEQTPSHTEQLPGGVERQWSYTDRQRGGYGPAGVGNSQDFGVSTGYGPGSGSYGNGPGAATTGTNRGQGTIGNTQGTSSGPGNSYNGTTGDGQNYTVTPGAGPGGLNRIQRIDPGSTGFSTGPGRGGNTSMTIDRPGYGDTEYSPGIPGGSDDGDMDSNYSTPIRPEKPSKNSKSKQQRSDPEDDPSYDAYPEVPKNQYKDMSKEPSPYVNPAWQKEQDRIKQQQQQPLPTTPNSAAPPRPSTKPIPQQLLLPDTPVADLPTTPNSPAPPRPTAKPAEPTPAPKPIADLPTTPNSPAPPRPTAKTAPTPVPTPNKEITSHPVAPTTIAAQTDSKPVDTTTVGSGKTTPVATPAPPSTGPKIDLPVVDLTPTHPDRPTKPDSSTPDAVDLHMVQEPPSKEPGIAQQILLPKNDPAPMPTTATPTKTNEPTPVEIVPMSQADQEKIFGPMPGQSSSAPAPAKKGDNGGGKAGSGSPSSSTAGGSEQGVSGEKGSSSSGDPWARPLVLKPGETPRGKFDDPGRVGAPDFKGTLLNPGTTGPNPLPGMPELDSKGNNPSAIKPTDTGDAKTLDINGPGNKSEGMERMLQLAGIKESTKVERQFLQESTVNKTNNIADTFKRLAGLK
jgi:hypothetical protein